MQVLLKKDKGNVDTDIPILIRREFIAPWGKLGRNDLEFKVVREMQWPHDHTYGEN